MQKLYRQKSVRVHTHIICIVYIASLSQLWASSHLFIYFFYFSVVVVGGVAFHDTVIASLIMCTSPLYALNFAFLSPLHQLAHTLALDECVCTVKFHICIHIYYIFFLFIYYLAKCNSCAMYGQFIVSLVWCCGFCGIHFSVSRIWCEFFNYLPANTKLK